MAPHLGQSLCVVFLQTGHVEWIVNVALHIEQYDRLILLSRLTGEWVFPSVSLVNRVLINFVHTLICGGVSVETFQLHRNRLHGIVQAL